MRPEFVKIGGNFGTYSRIALSENRGVFLL